MRPRNVTEDEFREMKERVRGGVVGTAKPSNGVRRRDECNRALISAAGSNPASSPPNQFAPYANKWELNFSKVLEMEQKVGAIKHWKYAGITFMLAKRQYHRIDFIIGHNDRSIEIAQIKGKWHKNIRAGVKGLKWAAQLYPMFTWTMKWWTGTGWDGKYVDI